MLSVRFACDSYAWVRVGKMKLKHGMALLLFHLAAFAFGSALFAALFHTPLFKGIDVYFYRGIALLALACAIVGGLVMAMMKFRLLGKLKIDLIFRDALLSVVLVGCVNMVFFTHLPVTAERSISVFVLGYMAQDPGRVYTEEDIRDIFIERYVDEYGAFQKRFHEQVVTGTVEPSGDGYVISPAGISLMRIYETIADWYGVDKALVAPSR